MSASLVGFLIGAVSAIGWATLDALRKSVGERVAATTAVAAMALFQLPLLVAALAVGELTGPFPEPWSGFMGGIPEVGVDYLPPMLGSIALNIFANWLFYRAVTISPLGLTVPYLSFTPVFTALTAFVVLGQSPTVWGLVGIFIVTVGAFFLNGGSLSSLRKERGSLYMIAVAGLWSLTPALDKVAVDRSSVLFHMTMLATGIFAAFWVLRAVGDRSTTTMLREMRAAPWLLALTGVLTVFALVLQLWAYAFIDVAYVETVKRALGVLAAVLVGWRVFGEGDLRRRLVAAAVIAVGVAAIVLGG